jgi:hypothetical protein
MGSVAGRTWIVALAAGLAAGAATDLVLVGVGSATIAGAQAGLVAAPLVVLAAPRSVRRSLREHRGAALVAFGAAWTLAPLIDQHLTQVVVIDGVLSDLIHHAAGWVPLLIGAQLVHRPHPSVIT